jgi:hypothetical protein
MKEYRLGNIVRRFTEVTGIRWIIKTISKLIGVDCGCDKRQEEWNKIKITRWKK